MVKIPKIQSAHDSESRNIINALIERFNSMGYTYDQAMSMAQDVLDEARQVNTENTKTNERLDNIIADSGTSSTEVVDARGEHAVLGSRLNGIDSQLEDIAINVKDFGAMGDGTTDDTISLQNASDFARSLGVDTKLLIPKGKYKTTDTVSFKTTLDADQAVIEYYGQGTAVILGNKSEPKIVTPRIKMFVPRVEFKERQNDGWVDNTIGIEVVNLNTCYLTIPFIRDFETGLLLHGYDQGCTYNTVVLGALWDNKIQLKMQSTETGWCNQTTFIGGRLQQTLSKGAILNDPNAKQLDLSTGGRTSNNTFINTSIEGENVSEYRVDIAGSYNTFINLRTENMNLDDPLKIMYRSGSMYNKFIAGYHGHLIEEVFEDRTTTGGSIDDGIVPHINARLKENLTVQPTTIEGWQTIKDMDSNHHRVKYNPETGKWIPRPGKWYVSVKIAMSSDDNGAVHVRIVKNNGTVSAQKTISNNGNYIQTVDISAIIDFDGTDDFEIRVQQSSGGELVMAANSSNTVEAFYLGGI